MKDEIKALEENNAWPLVEQRPGKSCIGYKWVYRVK